MAASYGLAIQENTYFKIHKTLKKKIKNVMENEWPLLTMIFEKGCYVIKVFSALANWPYTLNPRNNTNQTMW